MLFEVFIEVGGEGGGQSFKGGECRLPNKVLRTFEQFKEALPMVVLRQDQ